MAEYLITAVVAAYNEERHIADCLTGLLNQRDVGGEVEILVVDGGSTDRTIEVVQRFPEYGSKIRVVANPRRLQAFAWNIGIKNARGTYVSLISAHTEYDVTYLRSSLKVLKETGAANVGGVQKAIGDSTVGNVIAWAMSSPFGIGNGRFRYATAGAFVDHAFTFFAEKATFERVGLFDESYAVNEDCEFNYRLRKAGCTIFCSPEIRVKYHVRPSLPALARQMYRYGYWRRRTQLRHPEYVPLRVLAPPMTLGGLIVSVGLLAFGHVAGLALPLAYGAFLLVGAANAALKLKSPLAFLIAPIVMCTMHFSYGIGWWHGLFVHRREPFVFPERTFVVPELVGEGSTAGS